MVYTSSLQQVSNQLGCLDACLLHYWACDSLIECDFAGTISWTALATVVDSPSLAVAMVIMGSLGTACSDVVVDSIVVERSRGEPQVSCASQHPLPSHDEKDKGPAPRAGKIGCKLAVR